MDLMVAGISVVAQSEYPRFVATLPKVLEFLILVLDGAFQPVLTVQIHHHSALVEAMMAVGEIGFHQEREELLGACDLQDRSVVIAEMVVGPLPEVGMRGCGDLDFVIGNREIFRLASSGPFFFIDAHAHFSLVKIR